MSYNLVDNITGDLTRVAGGIIYADNPIGGIIPFGGSAIPSGYLLCNGQELSRTAYSELFAVIGTAFGTGDGSSTFNVPDLREMAIVGAGENTTLTIAAHDVYAVGEFKDDQLQEHTHEYSSPTITTDVYGLVEGLRICSASTNKKTSTNSGRIGSTTHGKQVGVNYIIKAKHVGIPVGFIDAVGGVVEGLGEKITNYTVGNGYTFTGTIVKIGKLVFIDGRVGNTIANNTGDILNNIPVNASGVNKDLNVTWLKDDYSSTAGISVLSFNNGYSSLSVGINPAQVGIAQISFSYITE